MVSPLITVLRKLTLLVLLSSLQVITPARGMAHETQPTIADMTVTGNQLELVLQINLEAFLGGIDLDEVQDTNDAENAQEYDTLRAMSAQGIATRAPDLLPGWNALPLISADGTTVTLSSSSVEMPQGIDPELARIAVWILRGALPEGARQVVVTWPEGGGPMVLRQQGVPEPFTGYMDGGQSSPEIDLRGGGAQSAGEAFVSYIPVGFDHILPKGLDHILFVLGLFFLSTRLRPLIWQVSAFTLAHTVTLALGALGWVNVPGSIVEPLIAASIVYVAVENILSSGLSPWRPIVVFGFGLLHGLGFASVLGEFGLPEGQFIPALIGFNIGVELGQLTVIALAAGLLWLALRAAMQSPLKGEEVVVRQEPVMFRAVSITASLLIAIIAIYWVIERVFF